MATGTMSNKRAWNESQDLSRNSSSPVDGQFQGPSRKRASFSTAVSPPYLNSVNGRHGSILNGQVQARPNSGDVGATGAAEHDQTQQQQQSQQDMSRPVSSDKPKHDQPTILLGITRRVKACAACRKQKVCLLQSPRPFEIHMQHAYTGLDQMSYG